MMFPSATPSTMVTCGALFLIATAVGHLFFVDISLRYFTDSIVVVEPVDILSTMSDGSFDWGMFGQNSIYRVVFGFSFWLAVSLVAIALLSLTVAKHEHAIRDVSLICAVASMLFTIVAFFSFIIPPTLGGLGATFCYSLAYAKASTRDA